MAVASPGATTSADPLGCAATVHDPGGVLDRDELDALIVDTAAELGADLRVRAESNVDNSLEARLDQLRRQCAGWDNGDGELADDMVVLMFSPVERETAIYFGASDEAGEVRWDEATDAMIPALRDGDYTEAVEAALQELGTATGSSSSDESDEEGGGGLSGSAILLILALVVVIGYSAVSKMRRVTSGEEGLFDSGDDDDGGGQGWWSGGSSSRRRRSSGFSSSSRRSSRSSSRSGRSRRSGGGSKKW